MRYLSVAICAILSLGLVSADTLTLKDGSAVNGTFLGGTARQIRMEVGDNIQTFDIERISSIQFGSTRAAEPPAPAQRERGNVFRPDSSAAPAPSAGSGGELPQGTVLTVRMIDPIDSEVN